MNKKRMGADWENVSEVSLVYNPKIRPCDRPKIFNSEDIYHLLLTHWDMGLMHLQEQAKVLLLNRDNRVLGLHNLGSGGVAATYFDAKLIFALAVKAVASGIVLCHNHPSGNKLPGKADITITHRLKKMGELFGIDLVDHLIITGEEYYSFADEGLI